MKPFWCHICQAVSVFVYPLPICFKMDAIVGKHKTLMVKNKNVGRFNVIVNDLWLVGMKFIEA